MNRGDSSTKNQFSIASVELKVQNYETAHACNNHNLLTFEITLAKPPANYQQQVIEITMPTADFEFPAGGLREVYGPDQCQSNRFHFAFKVNDPERKNNVNDLISLFSYPADQWEIEFDPSTPPASWYKLYFLEQN